MSSNNQSTPVPAAFGTQIREDVNNLAKKVDKQAREAWIEGRIWVPLGGVMALAAPIIAFVAGFSGLAKWVGSDNVLIWTFLSGVVGVLALWMGKQGETEGISERKRGEALYALGRKINYALVDYDAYLRALAAGTPKDGLNNDGLILFWLQEKRDTFEEDLAKLSKFPPPPP